MYTPVHVWCDCPLPTLKLLEFGGSRNDREQENEEGEMASSSEGRGKKLLDRALDALRNAGSNCDNATGYVSWMWQYILLHQKRHPQEMGAVEVEQFLTRSESSTNKCRSHSSSSRRAATYQPRAERSAALGYRTTKNTSPERTKHTPKPHRGEGPDPLGP